ncbi:hypothetical protein DER45DRAFT_101205 [Fusarium avenaceum]|nr:hypothetical protein DER45DRAFT_101205 [Fusarium avenaceum]
MEFASCMEPFTSPRAPFLGAVGSNEFVRSCEAEHHDLISCPNTSAIVWDSSPTNPKNRIDKLQIPSTNARWRIDGCGAMGRLFFAAPVYMSPNVPVRYINLLLPCQSLHPTALRHGLHSTNVICTPRRNIGDLGISQYVVQALDSWSLRMPYFDDIYRNIAFGSLIIFEDVPFNPQSAKLRFVARRDFEPTLRSLNYFPDAWDIPAEAWPPTLPVNRLRFVEQLSQTVAIIQLPDDPSADLFVFKTNLSSINRVYHELKVYMTMKSHSKIIEKPQYLVSNDGPGTISGKLLGFVVRFIPGQTLGDVLDSPISIPQSLKLSWATQLVRALLHVKHSPAGFYSDLKPDNVLVCSPEKENILLIDLEQGGNWDTFCAPEILYTSWLKRLATDEAVPRLQRSEYEALICSILPNRTDVDEPYSNPRHGYYDEWTNLLLEMQESAMVFSLGKVLWCIFERCSHTANTLEEKYTREVTIEFPQFSKTPERLRDLIIRCTIGAPEFGPNTTKIQRRGNLFFAAEYNAKEGYVTETSPLKIVTLFQKHMESRLRQMRSHERAKARWLHGTCEMGDLRLLSFMKRPTLDDVMRSLDEHIAHK